MGWTSSCARCGAVFESTRADARFCSPRCRVAAHRDRAQAPPVTAATADESETPAAAFVEQPWARRSPDAGTELVIAEHRARVAMVKLRLDERLANGLMVPARELSQLLGFELHLDQLERTLAIRAMTRRP
jgi:hypothetical protein